MNWKRSKATWTTLYRALLNTSPDPLPLARHRAGFFMPPIHSEPWPALPVSKLTGKCPRAAERAKKVGALPNAFRQQLAKTAGRDPWTARSY